MDEVVTRRDGIPQIDPTVLGEGNMSTIAMINNDYNGQNSKHMAVRFNLIRELVKTLLYSFNIFQQHR